MDEPQTLLSRMIGTWDLTGEMEDVPLRQEVEARWVLGNQYVEMRCRSVLLSEPGTQPYEAIYLIGYHAPSGQYVLHLFDTFGVALRPVPGMGRREGNSIPFVFAYDQGPFLNRFTWDPETDAWDHELVDQSEGQPHQFARKHLRHTASMPVTDPTNEEHTAANQRLRVQLDGFGP
jgi:hypothetical protein